MFSMSWCPSPELSTSWIGDMSTSGDFACWPNRWPSMSFGPETTSSFAGSTRIRSTKARPALRSNHRPDRPVDLAALPGKAAANRLLRPHQSATPDFADQSLDAACADRLPALQVPMAGRVVFQVDQATSANQSVLWDQRERRQISSVDRRFDLCSGRDCEKIAQSRPQSLHNFADSQSDVVRKKADFTGAFRDSASTCSVPYEQPTELIPPIVGH